MRFVFGAANIAGLKESVLDLNQEDVERLHFLIEVKKIA
jgi:hypothetical protein